MCLIHKYKEIRICNDAGRLTRPVLKVKNNKLLITCDIIEKIKSKESRVGMTYY